MGEGPRIAQQARSWARAARTPPALLGALLLASLGLRLVWISNPNALIFDESYYVNAARTIAGVPVPADQPYAHAPSGLDPNTEHAPLGKLLIAASIELFGDVPLGWRAPSVLFGTLAILAMYWMARSAGAGSWVALGAAGLMAADNLFLVHGRIGTLDIFIVAFMLAGAALYLRGRPIWAGIVLGIGACTKVVGLSALVVLAVAELLPRARAAWGRSPGQAVGPGGLSALAACALAAAVSYLVLLGALDRSVTRFPDPLAHTRHMAEYAGRLTRPAAAVARAAAPETLSPVSSPWQWPLNREPINYYRRLAAPPGQPGSDRVLVFFQGRMTPFIIWLAVPAFAFASYRAWAYGDKTSMVAFAWCLGTFLPFVVLSLRDRVGYLYYMLIVLPGVYLALAESFARCRPPRVVMLAYAGMVVFSFAALFPFRTWAGV